jgi:hypothetical protein
MAITADMIKVVRLATSVELPLGCCVGPVDVIGAAVVGVVVVSVVSAAESDCALIEHTKAISRTARANKLRAILYSIFISHTELMMYVQ